MTALRPLLAGLIALALAACAAPEDLTQAPEPLGDFSLGYTVVVVDNPELGPFSRKAEDGEWQASLEEAIKARFERFQGKGTYHIAIKVQAYALAQPGIPLVLKPRSVLLISANVWRPTGKINPDPKNITVWEGVSEKTFLLGSGLTQTRDEQMVKLSANAAREIEEWLREHPDWFRPDGPVTAPGAPPN